MVAVSAPPPLEAPRHVEEAESEAPHDPPPGGGLFRTLALAADPAELATTRLFYASAAADFGFDEIARYQITTAANEALSNAIQHGAPFGEGVIYLRAAAEDGKLVCSVRDAGRLKPPGDKMPDPSAEQGRGLSLMLFLMDEVALEADSSGTVARLSKHGPATRSRPRANPGPRAARSAPTRYRSPNPRKRRR